MRLYNGCPDSELKAILDETSKLEKKLKKLNPEAHCTYHHPTGNSPHGFQVHEWGKEITGFFPSKNAALIEAIKILSKKNA